MRLMGLRGVGECGSQRYLYVLKSVRTRKSPSYLARRLATVGLQFSAVMMMRIRIIQRFTRGLFAPIPALKKNSPSYRPVRTIVRKCSKCCHNFCSVRGHALFVRGGGAYIFSVGPSGSRRGTKSGNCLNGLALMES